MTQISWISVYASAMTTHKGSSPDLPKKVRRYIDVSMCRGVAWRNCGTPNRPEGSFQEFLPNLSKFGHVDIQLNFTSGALETSVGDWCTEAWVECLIRRIVSPLVHHTSIWGTDDAVWYKQVDQFAIVTFLSTVRRSHFFTLTLMVCIRWQRSQRICALSLGAYQLIISESQRSSAEVNWRCTAEHRHRS